MKTEHQSNQIAVAIICGIPAVHSIKTSYDPNSYLCKLQEPNSQLIPFRLG